MLYTRYSFGTLTRYHYCSYTWYCYPLHTILVYSAHSISTLLLHLIFLSSTPENHFVHSFDINIISTLDICSGPLHVNNCLWQYAKTNSCRSSLVRADGQPTAAWTKQRSLFGPTHTQQLQCLEREKKTYFGLVNTNSIVDIMHMCHTFKSGTADHDHDTWLQTVKLFWFNLNSTCD